MREGPLGQDATVTGPSRLARMLMRVTCQVFLGRAVVLDTFEYRNVKHADTRNA